MKLFEGEKSPTVVTTVAVIVSTRVPFEVEVFPVYYLITIGVPAAVGLKETT